MAKIKTIKLILILSLILQMAIGTLAGCKNGEKTGLSISLVGTGDVVLTDRHIKSYDWQTHTIELNEKGIQQWNSFHTYTTIPKLAQSLYGKNFIVNLNGKELYRGKFYSMVSSASYSGVVILDAVLNLDDERNTILIDFGYPSTGFGTGDDPRNSPELLAYLTARELLK